MFEKFTENAINSITEAQAQAKEMHSSCVQPEHLLLAIIKRAKGVPLKLFRMYDISLEDVKVEVENKLRFEKIDKVFVNSPPFSQEFKELLKNIMDLAVSSGKYVLSEHLFLAVIEDKYSYSSRILQKMDLDIEKTKDILYRMVQKKQKKHEHPELEDTKEKEQSYTNFDTDYLFEDEKAREIYDSIQEKMSKTNFEMIGTEQIVSAILASTKTNIYETMVQLGLSEEIFEQNLKDISSRKSEYGDVKVLLTPAAFDLMENALEVSKEMGSPTIKAEHIMLALLKNKKGLAYEVIKKMKINEDVLKNKLVEPIEKQMPQSLTILKLAKEEARRLGRNVVGTEMILLGILAEGTGIGYSVLKNLEISLRDLREIIEKTIGYGNEYSDAEITFTRRAKRVLEVAWQKAKKYKHSRILSENLLYAITTEPSSVAMMALEQLGVDAVEIRQGIKKEIEQ